MITRKTVEKGAAVKVTFSLPADNGGVSVVGDFNNWETAATPLRKRGETRSASVILPAGSRYAFRYLGEHGRWFDDDQADALEDNELGGKNGVLQL